MTTSNQEERNSHGRENNSQFLGGGIGGHVAANVLRKHIASGDFYATPEPTVQMRRPGYHWHWGKVLFERWWLAHWF